MQWIHKTPPKDDLPMIDRLLAYEMLSEHTRTTFERLRQRIASGETRRLSPKQRGWLLRELDRREPRREYVRPRKEHAA